MPQDRSPREIRINEPVRNQVEMVYRDLNATLPEGHPARLIWAFIEKMDLRLFHQQTQVYTDGPGQPAASPVVWLALWLYATTEGIGSARRLAVLCERDDATRWICGGVPSNYHMLSDFRILHKDALDGLMTDILAAMMAEGFVHLQRVAQDGMRVRASAGAGSFRRGETLCRLREEAVLEVKRFSEEVNVGEETKRENAARQRAARERRERLDAALAQLGILRPMKTTEAEARVMKMGDGGFRPAFNVQMATDAQSQVVVGVSVVLLGSDANEAMPMIPQVSERTEKRPEEYLVDGGYANKATVEGMASSDGGRGGKGNL